VCAYCTNVSCRLFEDGGNFCTAEVTDYTKRLDKTSQLVTSTEQSLSAELRNIEPKKVDQIAKIIHDFQDRWLRSLIGRLILFDSHDQ